MVLKYKTIVLLTKTHPLFKSIPKLNTISLHFTTCYQSQISYKPQEKSFLYTNTQQLFDESPERKNIDNNSLLFECSRNGFHSETLNIFVGTHRLGVSINGSSLSCVLKACGYLFNQNVGKQVHCYGIKSGFMVDLSVGTSLVNMFMKNENVVDGRKAFDEMVEKNVVTWTSLLGGYSQNGNFDKAIEVYFAMQREGVEPNAFTFSTVFGAFANAGGVKKAVQVHCVVVKNGFDTATSVGNSLINLYSKSCMVRDAMYVFETLENKDDVTWNGMIAGFVTNNFDIEALKLFYRMRLACINMTQMIFATIVKLCAKIKELNFAKQLHSHVLKNAVGSDMNIRTALMVCYSKCNEMDNALRLFYTMRGVWNVVSWTAMISGYLQNGGVEQAVNLFSEMRRERVSPNHFTYSTILTAHPTASLFQIQAQIIKSNYEHSNSVGTALLDAYIKIGNTNDAAKVFELIESKDIMAWSAMLSGYANVGDIEGSLKIFHQLKRKGVWPNEFTFSSVINACASPNAAVEQGKQVHASSIKSGFNNVLVVSSALVTMYAKRGNIEGANIVFERQKERDLVSWNSMISGYAQHGFGEKALKVFETMRKKKLEMDGITFIGVITACTHAGLVEEGQKYFDSMVRDFRIKPTNEHYSCMVDLYSRAGMLEKAMDLVETMPFEASPTVWRTILGACRVRANLDIGKIVAEKIISLQPQDSAAYVLLSNMYATAGNWKERAKVRKLMEERRVKKETGYSWIEVKNKTYSFVAGDHSHPMTEHIYLKLEELKVRLKDKGYQPDTNYVLHDVEDEHKEAILSQHSERLAIAFGLIATPFGTPIQIMKNLRVCGDCHTVIKLVSLIEEREIVVRDSNRFHHFKGGICSCCDYW